MKLIWFKFRKLLQVLQNVLRLIFPSLQPRVLETGHSNNYLQQDTLDFILEVLQATVESMGDSKVVYPLLQQNLDKLDNNFADILRNWATAKFSEVQADVAEYIAKCIGEFNNLIHTCSLKPTNASTLPVWELVY